MSVVQRTRIVTVDQLDNLRQPRRDLLVEESVPDDERSGIRDGTVDSWRMVEGPFEHYKRTLAVKPTEPGPTDERPGPLFEATERTTFKLAIPLWWPYLLPLIKRAIADTNRTPRRRWWWPQDVVSADTTRLLAALGAIGTMAGYMGVVISQTLTFAAEDFGVDDQGQLNTLGIVRIGVLLSFVFLRQADRVGRRPLTLWFVTIAILFTAVGAFSPNIMFLGGSQTIARGLTTGLLTLITVASTEEVPASSRALSIGFLTITTGFGAAMTVWALLLIDRNPLGWRMVYLLPVLFLPLLYWLRPRFPETKRFVVANEKKPPDIINWKRFSLVAFAAFASGVYLSPASQLRNEYLRDDLSFSPDKITMFQVLVSIPATVAIPVAGYMADRYGRRWLGAGALSVSAIFSALSYQLTGINLWLTAAVGATCAAAAVPALRGYQTELFPTRSRGRVGGMLDVVVVSGSATGLFAVGYLVGRSDDLGRSIATMVFAPILVAIVIILFFPETAEKELEEFNPDDPELASPSG